MHRPDATLSPQTFERLIARAVQIDEQGTERIDPARAREIATELGISAVAWDAALVEWAEARRETIRPRVPRFDIRFVIASAVAGGAAGTVMGVVSNASSGSDIAIGGALIAAALTLSGYVYARRSFVQAQASLGAWWIAALPGIAIGIGDLTSDAGVYASVAWAGCALAITLFDRIARRTRQAFGAP